MLPFVGLGQGRPDRSVLVRSEEVLFVDSKKRLGDVLGRWSP